MSGEKARVRCLHCGWAGEVSQLVNRQHQTVRQAEDPADCQLCPTCGSLAIVDVPEVTK